MTELLDLFRFDQDEGSLAFWLQEIIVALAILLAFWIVSRLFRKLLGTVGVRFSRLTRSELDDRMLNRIAQPAATLIVLAGCYLAVRSLPLSDRLQTITSGTVYVLNIALITFIAHRVMEELLRWYASRFADHAQSGLDRQIIPLAQKLALIFLVSTALIITLAHFHYDIISLVTALGIGSLAIGMAAKDTLANMISGFTLMIDRPLRIGDRIQLSGGQWGDVTDIGLRSTRIRTLDNALQIIPNSTLCNSIVTNMTFPDRRCTGKIMVSVAHGSPVGTVKQLLLDAALLQTDVLRDPAPAASLTTLGDPALTLSLVFWVDDYSRIGAVTDSIIELILTTCAEHGIGFPNPAPATFLRKEEQWSRE